MSEEGEPKTELPNDDSASESKEETLQAAGNSDASSSGSKMDKLPSRESRYGKTFQVFQQMGLLDYALQISKLSKDSEQLQEKINKLEMEVNESSQKTSQDLKDKLEDKLEVSQTTS